MRSYYARLSPAERRRIFVAGRDPDRVREQHRRKMARRRAQGTSEQQLKMTARDEVRKALLRGDLKRGCCEVCGAAHAHAHHDDYGKPLEVRWLCRTHHDALHAALSVWKANERKGGA